MGTLLPRWRLRAVACGLGLALIALILGCADDPMPSVRPPPHWSCPSQWVPHALGGCGPAVILCRPDGGAVQGACDGLDLTHPHPVDDGDGGVGATFYWLPDGGIGGAWPESPFVSSETDAGSEGASPAAVAVGIPSCPSVWRRLDDGICEPVFTDNCSADQEYPDPGTTPSGARILYVRAGSSVEMPTGAVNAPFPLIAPALRAASGETWILVAPGTYAENLSVRGRIHLAGCRQRVIIAGIAPGRPTISVSETGDELELRGVTIRGVGRGVQAQNGVHVTLEDVDLNENENSGVYSLGGDALNRPTRIDMVDCTVLSTTVRQPLQSGDGVSAGQGGGLTALRTLIQGNVGGGVYSFGVGGNSSPSQIELTDCVVRGTQPSQDRQDGFGIWAFQGGMVVANRTLIHGSHSVGVRSSGTSQRALPARIELTDSIVEDTQTGRQVYQLHGLGLQSDQGGVLIARRTLIRRNRDAGAVSLASSASNVPSRIELTDSVVQDTLPREDGQLNGVGVDAERGAELTAIRTLLSGNHTAGANATAAAWVRLIDCSVRETHLQQSTGTFGVALAASFGGRLEAIRVLAERNQEGGAIAAGPLAAVNLEDVLIMDNSPNSLRGGFGVGAAGGGRGRLRRVAIIRTHGAGLAAVSDINTGAPTGSQLEVEDAFIEGVALSPIQYDPCARERGTGVPRAYGAYVGSASSLDLRRVAMLGGETAAAAFGGELSWIDGVASRFSRLVVRGVSVTTPSPRLQNVVTQAEAVPLIEDDPTLSNESFALPALDPTRVSPSCVAGP